MTFPDGTIKEGRFENNIFIGPAGEHHQSMGDLHNGGSESEGGGSGHKRSARSLLQPLLIKKTVAPNENKNFANNGPMATGYMSTSSHNSAIKNTTLRTIKEEATPVI